MRSPIRTVVVLAVAAVLVVVFLNNVDLWRVLREIGHARPQWLALSLATLTLGVVKGQDWGWVSLGEFASFAVAVVSFIALLLPL